MQELVEKRYKEVRKTGSVSPRKRLIVEAGVLEGNGSEDELVWEEFDMHESSQDISKFLSDLVIKGLQFKVDFLSKKLRSTPLKEI